MSRRTLIIGAAVSGLLLMGVVWVVLATNQTKTPAGQPEIMPTASASPSVEAEDSHREVSGEARMAKEKELNANPLLKILPYDTAFWSLEFSGVEGGRYVVTAFVYHSPEQDAQAQIAKQRPFIERFIGSTKQPAGSYVVKYEPRRVDRNPQ